MWKLDHKEGWALKNWCFQTVVLEKTLENLLDSKEIKPVSSKGNWPWISIGLMLKLKLQYFGHLMGRADSLEKTLKLRKSEGRRRRGWQRMRWLYGIINSMEQICSNLSKLWRQSRTAMPGLLLSMGLQRVGHHFATEQQRSSQWPFPIYQNSVVKIMLSLTKDKFCWFQDCSIVRNYVA